MSIYITRHGKTYYNFVSKTMRLKGIEVTDKSMAEFLEIPANVSDCEKIFGKIAPDLNTVTPYGIEQAKKLGKYLDNLVDPFFISSTQPRTIVTRNNIALGMGLDLGYLDSELDETFEEIGHEISFSEWDRCGKLAASELLSIKRNIGERPLIYVGHALINVSMLSHLGINISLFRNCGLIVLNADGSVAEPYKDNDLLVRDLTTS